MRSSFFRSFAAAGLLVAISVPTAAGQEWTITGSGITEDRNLPSQSDGDGGTDMALDAEGNLYVVGHYYGGSLAIGDSSVSGPGGHDPFLAQVDPRGRLEWMRSGGSSRLGESARAVAVTPNGGVVVGGSFGGTAQFDTITFSSSWNGGFLLRYSPDGDLDWGVHTAEGSVDDVAIDTAGNIYATFGNRNIAAKYSSDGEQLWSRSAPRGTAQAPSNVMAFGVAVHPDGGCVVTGAYSGTAEFGDFSAGIVVTDDPEAFTAGPQYGMFVVRYDDDGEALWLQTAVGPHTWGRQVAVDQNGNIFVAGHYQISTRLGSFELSNYAQRNGNNLHGLVAKYASSGEVLWVDSFYGRDVTGMILDDDGAAYLCTWRGRVIKMDTVGNMVWYREPKLTGWHRSRPGDVFLGGLELAGKDTLYLTGTYSSLRDVDGYPEYTNDVFVRRYEVPAPDSFREPGSDPSPADSPVNELASEPSIREFVPRTPCGPIGFGFLGMTLIGLIASRH